jgi:alpha-tubulin suppressor-like RCC1 family protein
VRPLFRVVLAAAVALLPAGIAASSCSTGAVGVTACREIEYARCAVAPKCMTGFDTAECERFYYNFCLVGVQNLEAGVDPNTVWGPCVTAINDVADCVNAPASSVNCQKLIPDASCLEADAAANACNLILDCPELLPACAFVAAPVIDAGDAASTACSLDTNCATGQFCYGGTCGTFVSVAAGATGNSTCGLTSGGGVLCWGQNADGELGNGTTTDSSVASETAGVANLSTGVTAIATASQHSCAVWNNSVQCWGDNASGDLGNNSATQSLVPVPVAPVAPVTLTNATSIATGANHSCAVKAGTVYCWGANESGELGNNSTTPSSVPVQVSGALAGVTAIAAGATHTCALASGGVLCWGNNGSRQLGNNSSGNNSSTPVPVTNLTSGVVAIGAGNSHTCAVTSAGAVMCWGSDSSGQLGDGTMNDTGVPVAVSTITSGATALALGTDFTCALVAGAVQCWGIGASGQLGNGQASPSVVPVPVTGLTSGVTSIAAGDSHVCAVVNSAVQCWGSDSHGQLGDGTNNNSNVPVLATLP